jgi:hypothetical protein
LKNRIPLAVSKGQRIKVPGKSRNYILLNIIFAGIIICIIIYSGIFSPSRDNYPVQCIHEQVSGLSCPSCGLSHSFSYIIRGNIKEAAIWNVNGLRVFLFFVLQLVIRLSNLVYLKMVPGNTRRLVLFDISISVISFIIAFNPFIRYYITLLF